MRKEYDFKDSKKNPYAEPLKQRVTILLERLLFTLRNLLRKLSLLIRR